MTNIVPEQRAGDVEISGFHFDSEIEPGPIYYSTESDRVQRGGRGGNHHAAVLIRLDVDDWFTSIDVDLSRSSDTRVLDRAIAALTELRDKRQQMGRPGQGQCMAAGDWGRCRLSDGHQGERDHRFPTEDECRTQHSRAFARSA